MKTNLKCIFLLLLVLLFISCRKDDKVVETQISRPSLNEKWEGEEIIFPETLIPFKDLGSEIVRMKPRYIIAAYYDGNCSMCYNELIKWKEVIQKNNELNVNISYKFILSGYSKSTIEAILEKINFPLNFVFYDSNDDFNENYSFLKAPHYRRSSMLLDSTNHILFIGNPTISELDDENYTQLMRVKVNKEIK